jgi:hypothetical protein
MGRSPESEVRSSRFEVRGSTSEVLRSRGLGYTPAELRRFLALRSPAGIQRTLDAMPYHLAKTAWSPRRVLREGTAHCLEGAIFAAAALRVLGFPPLLLDLEAVQDTDHVIAVYRESMATGGPSPNPTFPACAAGRASTAPCASW